jgi:hypothetical protein
MIVIDKAILHILDFNSGMTVLSDAELSLEEEGIQEFLEKHIARSLASQDAKEGKFYADSDFAKDLDAYLAGGMDFVSFSKKAAHTLEQALLQAEEMKSADFIVGDIRVEDRRKIVLMKSNSHQGYVHQVTQTEGGIKNDIINHYAILPGLTQRMDEFAFIDVETKSIFVQAKKYTIDGNSIFVFPEILLECENAPSPKEAIKKVNAAVKKVAEAYGQDEVETAAAVKSFVAGKMQESDELNPLDAGKEVFHDNPAMQADYETQIKEAGFTEPVHMDQEQTLKKMRSHKLKTDTGIELTIPIDYFDSTEYVEFNNNADGSLSITLKHIQNIMNRG